jgi:hypothetical protein
VPNPCFKADMRESARPEADLHRPVSSTQRNATATSRATPSQLQLRDPTTSTDPATIASKRPAYGSAGPGHPLFQMGRPSGNGRRYLGQAQAILALPRFPPSDLATRWIADGNLRAVAVGVFPRAHDLAQPRFTLLMPGIDRRVFPFTCIAKLCNGRLDNRSSLPRTQEIS